MFIRERKKTWVNSIVRVDRERERDGEKEGEGMERGERKTRRRTRREGGLDGGAKRRQRNAIRARNKEVVDDSNLSCFRPAEEARPPAPVDPEEDGRARIESEGRRRKERKEERDGTMTSWWRERHRKRAKKMEKRERKRERGFDREKDREQLDRKQLLARCNENIRASVSRNRSARASARSLI